MKLYTFAISHFSEKVRWTLDVAGVGYEEVALTPGLHLPRTLALSRRATSVPILAADGRTVQDSTRILRWLAEHRAAALAPLWPRTPDELAACATIEGHYDGVGTAVMRYGYADLLDDAPLLLKLWSLDAGALERRLLRLSLPGLRLAFRRRFRVDAAGAARAQTRIAAALDELARQVSRQRHLVGRRFGVADITVAALLAPLACPDEHPVYGSAAFRAPLAPKLREWDGHPALDWVRETYRRHRAPLTPAFAATRNRLEA